MSSARGLARRALQAVVRAYREGKVVPAVTAALLAFGIAGLVPPDHLVRGAASAVGGLFLPGPSEAEQSVDSLYDAVFANSIWRSEPEMSEESKQALVDRWGELDPDMPHEFSADGVRQVEIPELLIDHSLDGDPVVARGFVTQLYHVTPVPGSADWVSAKFRLESTGGNAWCSSMTFERDDVPRFDQLVEAVGLVIARGAASTASGGFVNGTYLACSAVRPVLGAEQEVAELFRDEEESPRWLHPPSILRQSRDHLLKHWDRLSPYRPHPYPRNDVEYVGLDRLFEDSRLDGREVGVAGYVTQRSLSPGREPGLILESYRLEAGDEESLVWCITTLQSRRVFAEGERVAAVGVPIARGSVDNVSGGFNNDTIMVCPAARVY